MSDENPTRTDIWRLLGTMNRRFVDRFDMLEREVVQIREEVASLKSHVNTGFSALRESIEARDFRLDDHGRRLKDLETPRR